MNCKHSRPYSWLMISSSVGLWGSNRLLPPSSSPSQDPFVMGVSPERGPKAGGTSLTITGRNLLTGRSSDLTITVGGVPCNMWDSRTHAHTHTCTSRWICLICWMMASLLVQSQIYYICCCHLISHCLTSDLFLSEAEERKDSFWG